MSKAVRLSTMIGSNKPLVSGSNPLAATSNYKSSLTDQGIHHNPQAYSHANHDQGLEDTWSIYT
ncbi:unnamed protein product [marine sediment metagenome]|uniref:Uncharacterized protein n=1 Tax=marine sediment metagenome TaxID=412755 RepID=X1I9H3_9ZZZZ